VVRSNGEPGEYRWGVGRKQQLLALEHAAAPQTHAREAEPATNREMLI
jgi:hypothetical protein